MVAVNKRYTIAKRRKREQKTDYHKRLALLKSGKLRVVVRRSSNNILAQLVKYEPQGDKVMLSADTQELSKLGWPFKKNMPTAYLVGYLLANKAKKNKVAGEVVLDVGFFTPISGSRIFAVAKGCVEGGLNLLHSPEVFPADERINGKHIGEFVKTSKLKTQFSKLKSSKVNVENITELFEKTKSKITGAVN